MLTREPSRYRDPTWPYEDVDETPEAASEPAWACPAGECTCHPGGDAAAREEPFFILLCDEQARRMPEARCRVLANGILLNEDTPHADGSGWIQVKARRMPEQLLVEWAPPDTPLAPPYPYRKLYYLDLAPGDRDEAARRRLHNLGHSVRLTLADNIEDFQRAHDQPVTGRLDDVEATLTAYHDTGAIPPRSTAQVRRASSPAAMRDDAPPPLGAPRSPSKDPPPPPPGGTTGTSAPPPATAPAKRLTIAEAIERFKGLIADDRVVRGGQWAWGDILAEAVVRRAVSLINSYPPLRKDFPLVRDLSSTAYKEIFEVDSDLWCLRVYTGSKFSQHLANAKKLLKAHDQSVAAVKELQAMLEPAGQSDAAHLYNDATKSYSNGDDKEVYDALFATPKSWRFTLLSHMSSVSEAKCRDFANHTARRLRRRFYQGRQGLHGPPPVTPNPITSDLFTGHAYCKVRWDPATKKPSYDASWGEMVLYRSDLDKMVDKLKAAFDPGSGWVVRAGVASGLLADKGLGDPDHYILIIGNDDDDFAFWDPDSWVTKSPEIAFGRIYHRKGDGSAAVVEPGFPTKQHAANGRLANAVRDVELRCEDGLGGTLASNNHRYQVTNLCGV